MISIQMRSADASRTCAQAAKVTHTGIVQMRQERVASLRYDEITKDAVAKQTEFVQKMVVRFGRKKDLLADAVRTLAMHINSQRDASDGDLTSTEVNRLGDYEKPSDRVLRLLARQGQYATMKERFDFGHSEQWKQAQWVFAVPLGGSEDPSRFAGLEALIILTLVCSGSHRARYGESAAGNGRRSMTIHPVGAEQFNVGHKLKVAAAPKVHDRLMSVGFEPNTNLTSAQLSQSVKEEFERNAAIVKQFHIQMTQ